MQKQKNYHLILQIKRVLVNLLGNAITYAYNDTDIEVVLSKQDRFAKVQITNYSPYINPSLLKNLFQKYVTHAAKYNKILKEGIFEP